MTDHYAVLGVRRDAEFTVIEAAHRALLKRYHPDRNPGDAKAADRAKAANAAFDVLKDSDARARYDRTLSPEGGQAHEPPPRSPPPPPPHRPASSPPTQRRPVAAASGGSSRALSMGFIGLALLVGVGAIGSLTRSGEGGPPQATETPVVDAAASPTPAPARSRSARVPTAPATVKPEASDAAAHQPEPVREVAVRRDRCGDASAGLSYWLCADADIRAAEQRLNRVYNERLRQATDRAAFEAEQRDWRRHRDSFATDRDALLHVYQMRLDDLLANDLKGLY